MKKPVVKILAVSSAVGLASVVVVLVLMMGRESSAEAVLGASLPAASAVARAKPALSVTTVSAVPTDWAQSLSANGSVAAWQETVVSAEQGGFRLTEVLANVGDEVKRGQLLARMSPDSLQVELLQSRASLAELKASLADAQANAERARSLQSSGAISAQQINQYVTAEQTAQARLDAQSARIKSDELRLSQTRIAAPDDGVISARTATVGSVAQVGQELFRLIRGGRLEWRAEVTAAELGRIAPGMKVSMAAPNGSSIDGKVRVVAPTIDPQTRNGIVYVDLPARSAARAGMFARGEFLIGQSNALTLPQSAVLLRDGFSYAYLVGSDSRVTQRKLEVGRRIGDRIEIVSGLTPGARVVATGGGFLSDGDLVRVVPVPAGSQLTGASVASR